MIFSAAPRSQNRRSWLYRIRPSVVHKPFVPVDCAPRLDYAWDAAPPTPNQVPIEKKFFLWKIVDFIAITLCPATMETVRRADQASYRDRFRPRSAHDMRCGGLSHSPGHRRSRVPLQRFHEGQSFLQC